MRQWVEKAGRNPQRVSESSYFLMRAAHLNPMGNFETNGWLTHQERSHAMFKKLFATALLASFVAGIAAGCNTIQGAGKDIERGGEKVQQEAQEHK